MEIAGLLRTHRQRRRLSQAELAAAAGISARHLSFVETGRSRPGRAVVAALARAMELPHREANLLLRAIGERPLYPDQRFGHEAARPLLRALERMLEAHMPWPAVVMDHAWRPVHANAAFAAVTRKLAQHAGSPPDDRGMMEWLFARDGLQPLVANWAEVAPFLLRRVRRESVLYPDLDALVERLEAEIDRQEGQDDMPGQDDAVLPLHLVVDGRSVRLFSLLAGFGSALDASIEELRIEYFCPIDDESDQWLQAVASE